MGKEQPIDILCLVILLYMLLNKYDIPHHKTSPTDCDGCSDSRAISSKHKPLTQMYFVSVITTNVTVNTTN